MKNYCSPPETLKRKRKVWSLTPHPSLRLNDPTTPITLYIVLSRELSSQKMISGLMAALTPFLTNDKESAKKFEGFNPKDATFAVNSVLRFDVGDSVTKYTHPEGKQVRKDGVPWFLCHDHSNLIVFM